MGTNWVAPKQPKHDERARSMLSVATECLGVIPPTARCASHNGEYRVRVGWDTLRAFNQVALVRVLSYPLRNLQIALGQCFQSKLDRIHVVLFHNRFV